MFISGSSTSTASFATIRGGGGTVTDSTGTVSFENKQLEYTGKNYTQFTGLDALTSPCGIGSTVRSGIIATSYENGDLGNPVKLNVLGVLNKFVGSAINQPEDANINISQLGKLETNLLYSIE